MWLILAHSILNVATGKSMQANTYVRYIGTNVTGFVKTSIVHISNVTQRFIKSGRNSNSIATPASSIIHK